MSNRAYVERRLLEIRVPVRLDECPNPTRCRCGLPCRVCGFTQHWAVHAGCLDDPTRVFDHYYEPM